MSWLNLLIAGAAVALLSWAATWAVLRVLVRFELYDRPNARGSHHRPKPRGGGLALVPVQLVASVAVAGWFGAVPPGFWLGAARTQNRES